MLIISYLNYNFSKLIIINVILIMDKISKDIATLLLTHMNITTKKALLQTCKFWYDMIVRRKWFCKYHWYHCKICISALNKSQGCKNIKVIHKCNRCQKTFCKHARVKKCKQHGSYNKSRNICGVCAKCDRCNIHTN
jgi:hypothetical protein